jgi:hypothetical protein
METDKEQKGEKLIEVENLSHAWKKAVSWKWKSCLVKVEKWKIKSYLMKMEKLSYESGKSVSCKWKNCLTRVQHLSVGSGKAASWK